MTSREKYIEAVYNFDLDIFKSLLEVESFDESLLTDIGLIEGSKCPIYWLSQCWNIVLEHEEDWDSLVTRKIVENRRKNQEIMEIFKNRFGVTLSPVVFTNFGFLRDRFLEKENASFEDIFGESRDSLLGKDFKDIDIDLYLAVSRFDIDETKKLLVSGANPKVRFPFNGSAWGGAMGESDWLRLEIEDYMYDGFHKDPFYGDACWTHNLITHAAYERMSRLLKEYDANN